jgi:hypothetical protein
MKWLIGRIFRKVESMDQFAVEKEGLLGRKNIKPIIYKALQYHTVSGWIFGRDQVDIQKAVINGQYRYLNFNRHILYSKGRIYEAKKNVYNSSYTFLL